MKALAVLWVLFVFAFNFALLSLVIFVAAHFILKWW